MVGQLIAPSGDEPPTPLPSPIDEENVLINVESDLVVDIEDNVITISKPHVEEEQEANVNDNETANEVPPEESSEEPNVREIDEPNVYTSAETNEQTLEEPIEEVEEEPIEEPEEEPVVEPEPANDWQNFEFTHYTASCEGCTGVTSTGVDVSSTTHYNGMRVVAVNPAVIPYDTVLELKYPNGSTEMAIAKDTGGAIRARTDLLDILVSSQDEALSKGRMNGQIRIVE